MRRKKGFESGLETSMKGEEQRRTNVSRPVVDGSSEGSRVKVKERKLVKISDEDELEPFDGGFELRGERRGKKSVSSSMNEGKRGQKDEHVPSTGLFWASQRGSWKPSTVLPSSLGLERYRTSLWKLSSSDDD